MHFVEIEGRLHTNDLHGCYCEWDFQCLVTIWNLIFAMISAADSVAEFLASVAM
jgi:hypothetical protein